MLVKEALSYLALYTGVILFIPVCSQIIIEKLYRDGIKKLDDAIVRAEEKIKMSSINKE